MSTSAIAAAATLPFARQLVPKMQAFQDGYGATTQEAEAVHASGNPNPHWVAGFVFATSGDFVKVKR